jgi:hypothetical protein
MDPKNTQTKLKKCTKAQKNTQGAWAWARSLSPAPKDTGSSKIPSPCIGCDTPNWFWM